MLHKFEIGQGDGGVIMTKFQSNWTSEGEFRLYDPTLGYAHQFSDEKEISAIPGFDIWPGNLDPRKVKMRILTLGGSTTDYREGCRWAKFLADTLTERGHSVMVFNGGCGGYNSHQELQKLYRDSPALMPTHVISLSGINDFVGWSVAKHPMINPYQSDIGFYLLNHASAFDAITLGLPNPMKAHEYWLRNGRTMRFIAEDLGANYLQVIQPTLGSSPYEMNAQEREWLDAEGSNYLSDLTVFYHKVRSAMKEARHSHLFDLSALFVDERDLYTDSRHTNDRGNQMIAEAIATEVLQRFPLSE